MRAVQSWYAVAWSYWLPVEPARVVGEAWHEVSGEGTAGSGSIFWALPSGRFLLVSISTNKFITDN